MNPVIAINEAYTNYLAINFGRDLASDDYALPHFLATLDSSGLYIASNCNEVQGGRLIKAVEIFSELHNVPVCLAGFWYIPRSMAA